MLSRPFQLFFLTHNEFLNIFYVFLYPCYAQVKKYVKCHKICLVSKNILKLSRQHSGKWIAWLKFITAWLYKYQTYINSYFSKFSAWNNAVPITVLFKSLFDDSIFHLKYSRVWFNNIIISLDISNYRHARYVLYSTSVYFFYIKQELHSLERRPWW